MTITGVTTLATTVVVAVGGTLCTQEALDVGLAMALTSAVITLPCGPRTPAVTCCTGKQHNNNKTTLTPSNPGQLPRSCGSSRIILINYILRNL